MDLRPHSIRSTSSSTPLMDEASADPESSSPQYRPGDAALRYRPAAWLWLLTLAILTWMGSLNADREVHPDSAGGERVLSIEYLIDSNGEHDIDEVSSLGDVAWKPLGDRVANFGFSNATFWLRWQAPEGEAPATEVQLIEIAYPLLDHIDLFQIRPSDSKALIYAQWQLGDKLPFSTRPYPHRNFVVPVRLGGSSDQFVMRVKSSSALQIPIKQWSVHAFTKNEQRKLLGHGLYFGLLCGMMTLHLALAAMLRDRAYGYYAAWLGALIVLIATLQGFGMQFVWPESPRWNDYSMIVALALCGAGGVGFTFHFINERSNQPSRCAFWIASFLFVATLLGSLVLAYQSALFFAMAVVVLSAVTSTSYAIRSALLGSPQGQLYLVAFAALIFSGAVILLAKHALIAFSPLAETALQLASALQVLLLSAGLGFRFAQERGLRHYAQQALVDTRRYSLNKIEAEVADRTKKLERINRELTRLSITDALTGLPNRRYLDDLFAAEIERARQTGQPLSIGLIDIDHFKIFNDTHGHAAGDLCLRLVAQEIRRQAPRNGDMVARYGGEEFCVLMPNTHEDGARIVAERIRIGVGKLRINLGNTQLQTHVSIGIHTARSDELHDRVALLSKADEALYRAKARGRNQVVASNDPEIPMPDCEPDPAPVDSPRLQMS